MIAALTLLLMISMINAKYYLVESQPQGAEEAIMDGINTEVETMKSKGKEEESRNAVEDATMRSKKKEEASGDAINTEDGTIKSDEKEEASGNTINTEDATMRSKDKEEGSRNANNTEDETNKSKDEEVGEDYWIEPACLVGTQLYRVGQRFPCPQGLLGCVCTCTGGGEFACVV